ncbi:hypothetical protein JZ751_008568 [Albula glossodonta]|uniref:Ig-like domain-containing protein n=1 Tax=Albula glossodonta TaxID=121402 RepID=A0A8T2MN48_9TELE|nr:hypothetical protein JZ751_008568 [Albula glossodonta]
MQVSVDPDTVTEEQSVTLTCRTTCTLSKTPAFIWYRNNQRLSFTSQEHQITASSGDAGSYSCAETSSEPGEAQNPTLQPPHKQQEILSSSVPTPQYQNQEEMQHSAVQTPPSSQEEMLYCNVQPANSSSQEETLYSTVKKSHPMSEDNIQYASITFSKLSAAPRETVEMKVIQH